MKKKLFLYTAVIMFCASAIFYLINVSEKDKLENNSPEKSKERDSEIITNDTIKKLSNNSRFNKITTTRAEAKTLYLFFDTKPTKINK